MTVKVFSYSSYICISLPFFSSCSNGLFLPSKTASLSHWAQFPVATKTNHALCVHKVEVAVVSAGGEGCGSAGSRRSPRGPSFPASFTAGVAPSSSVSRCRAQPLLSPGSAAAALPRRPPAWRCPWPLAASGAGAAAAGAAETSGLRQGGKAGGDGQTDVSSRRRLRRTLPQRRPVEARRGRGHRRLGRCGGLLRGGKRGSGRLASPARPWRAAEAWGARRCGFARSMRRSALVRRRRALPGPSRQQARPQACRGRALWGLGSPASRTHRPGPGLSFSEMYLCCRGSSRENPPFLSSPFGDHQASWGCCPLHLSGPAAIFLQLLRVWPSVSLAHRLPQGSWIVAFGACARSTPCIFVTSAAFRDCCSSQTGAFWVSFGICSQNTGWQQDYSCEWGDRLFCVGCHLGWLMAAAGWAIPQHICLLKWKPVWFKTSDSSREQTNRSGSRAQKHSTAVEVVWASLEKSMKGATGFFETVL